MEIRKNDMVVLLKDFSGATVNKKGTTARVLKVFTKFDQVILEGVNVKHKHVRANTNRDYPKGGIIRKEAPIHISNVALFCPKCAKKTKPVVKSADGKRTRVCKTCGDAIQSTT